MPYSSKLVLALTPLVHPSSMFWWLPKHPWCLWPAQATLLFLMRAALAQGGAILKFLLLSLQSPNGLNWCFFFCAGGHRGAHEDGAIGTPPPCAWRQQCVHFLPTLSANFLWITQEIELIDLSVLGQLDFARILGIKLGSCSCWPGCTPPQPGRRARMDTARMALLRVPQQHSSICTNLLCNRLPLSPCFNTLVN